jgi:hypothetical protein
MKNGRKNLVWKLIDRGGHAGGSRWDNELIPARRSMCGCAGDDRSGSGVKERRTMVVRRRPIDMILFCRLRDAAFNIAPGFRPRCFPHRPDFIIWGHLLRHTSTMALLGVIMGPSGDHPTQNTSWDGQRKGEGGLHEEEKNVSCEASRGGRPRDPSGKVAKRRHESRETRQDEARRGKTRQEDARSGKTRQDEADEVRMEE